MKTSNEELSVAKLKLSRENQSRFHYFFVESQEHVGLLIDELNRVQIPEEYGKKMIQKLELPIPEKVVIIKDEMERFVDIINATPKGIIPLVTNIRDYMIACHSPESIYSAGVLLDFYREPIHERLQKSAGLLFTRSTIIGEHIPFLDSYSWKLGSLEFRV
jgi:hypothetical protein